MAGLSKSVDSACNTTKTDDSPACPELAPGQKLLEYPDLFPGLKLICSLNTDQEQLLANVKNSIVRDLPEVFPHAPNDDILAICAGGPTLRHEIDTIRDLVTQGAQVVALANVAHYLLEQGVRPSAHVILDARPNNANFLADMEGCTYFVASQCDPSVFDRLEGFSKPNQRTLMWHAINSSEELTAVLEARKAPFCRIPGGSTITLRSLQLFRTLGYSKFHLFGFDSCYIDGKHHAYDQPSADKAQRGNVLCGDREFEVCGWMLNQAMEFVRYMQLHGEGADIRVHGDGMIAYMVSCHAEKARSVIGESQPRSEPALPLT